MIWPDIIRTAIDPEIYRPESGIHLLGLLIIGLPASLPAFAALYVTMRGQRRGVRRWKEDRKLIADIHEQSVNDHPRGPRSPNMRDQIDRIEHGQSTLAQYVAEMRRWQTEQSRDISGLRQDIGGQRGELRDIRDDLTMHRKETREFQDRVRDFSSEHHPEAGNPI